ncbi:hypothetical protein FDENT_12531 [Fusarium denticulatum]|uniref:DUF7136 domain-containing protein n=1 Tax=Fusarium denticulatum TaxID=48507 RepID=A0A8H5T9L9_9HYPO|nr:hypothetical protein FDENT_12531 [Fusarium denticulatum]
MDFSLLLMSVLCVTVPMTIRYTDIMIRIFMGIFVVLGTQAKENPSSQFPIDLGAWPYGFKLQWRLEGNWETPIKKEDVPVVYGSAPDWLYSSGSFESATEPYFVINATGITSITSYTEWELGWSLSVLQECSHGPERHWKYGSIDFSILSSGSLPNYKPKGPCPLEIQHTRFLDNRTTSKEEGQGDPCSIETGHELATMVRAEMLRGESIAGVRGSDGWDLSINQFLKPGNGIATMLTTGGDKAGTTSGPGAAGDYTSGVYLGFVAGQPGNDQNGGDGGTANHTGLSGSGGGGGGARGWHQNDTAYGADSTVYAGEIAGSPGGGGASYAAAGLDVSETWQTKTAPGSVILTFF